MLYLPCIALGVSLVSLYRKSEPYGGNTASLSHTLYIPLSYTVSLFISLALSLALSLSTGNLSPTEVIPSLFLSRFLSHIFSLTQKCVEAFGN